MDLSALPPSHSLAPNWDSWIECLKTCRCIALKFPVLQTRSLPKAYPDVNSKSGGQGGRWCKTQMSENWNWALLRKGYGRASGRHCSRFEGLRAGWGESHTQSTDAVLLWATAASWIVAVTKQMYKHHTGTDRSFRALKQLFCNCICSHLMHSPHLKITSDSHLIPMSSWNGAAMMSLWCIFLSF